MIDAAGLKNVSKIYLSKGLNKEFKLKCSD